MDPDMKMLHLNRLAMREENKDWKTAWMVWHGQRLNSGVKFTPMESAVSKITILERERSK